MNAAVYSIFSPFGRVFAKRKNRRILYLLLICLAALGDFLYLGLARRTFIFYSNREGNIVVEDRMLRWSGEQETDIRRYVEEVLLGPFSPD